MKREKILLGYVVICMSFLLTLPLSNAQGAGFSLRFNGNGVNVPDQDRVKIQPDANTVALYHFDEGSDDTITDSSNAARSNGTRNFGGASDGTPPPDRESSTGVPPFGGPGAIDLQEIATGLANPVAITHAGDGSGRLFIVELAGRILVLQPGTAVPTVFLDISKSGLKLVLTGVERGLLSVAFHPDYPTTPFFYVFYTAMDGDLVNLGDLVIARYSVSVDPDVADPNSALILLTIAHSADMHNGGQLQFGPDGFLYISTGDGAAADNAQDLQSLLGKILRIDVDTSTPPDFAYAIPSDNPFILDPNTPNPANPEDHIWALGFRNPWRFSFDRATGDLFIGDVGEDSLEEVNYRPSTSSGGENYEWPCNEGTAPFIGGLCPKGTPTPPILEYTHSLGCSITGGYRYRGTQFPQGHGVYFYGDFCSGRIWGGSQNGQGDWTSTELIDTDFNISAFGEDEAGELYLAHLGGAIYRVVGNPVDPPAPPDPPDPPDLPDLIGQLDQLTKKIQTTTDELKFVVTVQNVGDLPFTINSLVRVFLSDDDILDASDTLVFEKKAQPKKLFPGGVEFIKGKAKVPTPAQGQFLILKIVPTNPITESDEGNILATLQIP